MPPCRVFPQSGSKTSGVRGFWRGKQIYVSRSKKSQSAMSIASLHRGKVDALELGRMPGKLNRIAKSVGPKEPERQAGEH